MNLNQQAPNFEAALRDTKSRNLAMRTAAAEALGHALPEQREQALAALRPLIDDDYAEVRYAALLSVGELRDQQALPQILERLTGDGHAMVRQAAVIALGLIADPSTTDTLIKALRSGPPEVRFQAAMSLAQVNAAAAIPHLQRALADDDREVRANVAAVLGEYGDDSVCADLISLLDDPFPTVTLEAAIALARRSDKRGAPVLAQFLDDKDHAHHAAEYLFSCPAAEVRESIVHHLNRWFVPPTVKVWLAGALARLGDDLGQQKLQEYLRSRRVMVRGLTIQVCGMLATPWARQALLTLRENNKDEPWCEEIDEALKAIDDKQQK